MDFSTVIFLRKITLCPMLKMFGMVLDVQTETTLTSLTAI